MRIGYGFDIHQLVEGRKLILGGLEIPFEKGLLGHSDADVLFHAITDALLGALALGDIGQHFPDTDPEHKDADSRLLLRHCYKLVKEKGYTLSNLDATIVAQRPKLMPHLPKIREIIASDLEVDLDQISVKATTSEKLGFVGREEGISATAVVLIHKR
jgi:2-C-methyl-D-erythritol 2,4-cyclodiphosphate synthase